MRRTRGSRARRLVHVGLAGLLAQAVLPAPSQAGGGPRISGSVTHTFAIAGTIQEGAMAFGLNALVPVDGDSGMFGLGVGMWADDMGQEVDRMLDSVTLEDLGAVGGSSLFVVGGGLAADFHPRLGSAQGAVGGPFLAGTAGVYYIESQDEGSLDQVSHALGWSLAAGWRFRTGALGSLGPSVHYHRLFDDQLLGRFMAAGLDWTWR